jgi:hypothetical protein
VILTGVIMAIDRQTSNSEALVRRSTLMKQNQVTANDSYFALAA